MIELNPRGLHLRNESELIKTVTSRTRQVGFNLFYSGMKYTENYWVRLKVRYYPLQNTNSSQCMRMMKKQDIE